MQHPFDRRHKGIEILRWQNVVPMNHNIQQAAIFPRFDILSHFTEVQTNPYPFSELINPPPDLTAMVTDSRLWALVAPLDDLWHFWFIRHGYQLLGVKKKTVAGAHQKEPQPITIPCDAAIRPRVVHSGYPRRSDTASIRSDSWLLRRS